MMINKRLISMMGDSKQYIAWNVVLQFLALLANIVMIFAVSLFLTGLVRREPDLPTALLYILGALIVRFFCTRGAASASYNASCTVKKTLRAAIYEKLLRLGGSYTQAVPTAEVLQLAGEGVEQLETYFGAYLPQFFYAMIAPVTLFIALAPVSLHAAVILMICVPLIPVSIVAVQKFAKKLLGRYWGQYAALGDSFLENLQGLTTLKIYQADGARHAAMNREAEHFRKVTMKVLTMQLNSIIVMDVIAYGGAALGIIVAAHEFNANRVTLPGALCIILLSADFFLPMRALGSYFHVAMNGMAASDKIFKLLDLPEGSARTAQLGADCAIACRDLHFGYTPEKETLHGLNLDFPQGSFTALVGESGCGKSTIAAVLTGRVSGYTGHVTIGGQELSAVKESALLKNVTLVSLGSHLFKGTVADNLRMAAPGADDGALWGALEQVNLADFLRSMDGLDTPLTEGGGNLSGGQRQRLALARALLHDSPVYIFDEATSNIDVESENDIMAGIHRLAGRKTVILISHRLANVTKADNIYVLDHGHPAGHARGTAGAGRAVRRPVEPPAGTGKLREGGTVMENKRTRGNLNVMYRLVGLVRPLAPVMVCAVLLGVAGFLCAIFIPVLGVYALLDSLHFSVPVVLKTACILLPILAVARGVLHYAEQGCNHFIAFKLLALIRDKVFGVLRQLAPAKLEGRDKGDLIAVLTADIELLEVFYAHTISPICIAVIVSVVMACFMGSYAPALGLYAALAYAIIGIGIPVAAARGARKSGESFRAEFGALNGFVLDSLRGVRESLQYNDGAHRLAQINQRTDALAGQERRLKEAGGTAQAVTGAIILLLDAGMLALAGSLFMAGAIGFDGALVSVVALMSSFGPVIALANLGTGLQSTFAAGNRVLDILDEQPAVREVTDGRDIVFRGADARRVTFGYRDSEILKEVSLHIPEHGIVGITGRSGSGKSTLLKLLMRFWDTDLGQVEISGENIKGINTASLRAAESFVEQDTVLFHDSIEENVKIANRNATHEQVVAACRKASIHDFIMTLPQGYDTPVGELGDTLSGGERQRLGVARAFLHDAPFILLDEPTSNLDSLNEAVILRSLAEERASKTVVLVSHRASTMRVADTTYSVENGRMS